MDKLIKDILATHGYTFEESEDFLNNAGRAIFNAGQEEERKGGTNSIAYLEGLKEGEKLGIKEVVEWIKENTDEEFLNYAQREWQDKLKEWGIGSNNQDVNKS